MGRMTLRYDFVFLAGLLLALIPGEEYCLEARCPFRRGTCLQAQAQAIDYCADMNLLLAYYKLEDDWRDDRNLLALVGKRMLARRYGKAAAAWPDQVEAIRVGLADLGLMERRGEPLADLLADCFGKLMGTIFAPAFAQAYPQLRALGCALGRLIYMMDATIDLHADLRRGRYNPLTFMTAVDDSLLTMLAAQASEIYETLPLRQDKSMLDAVIYTGLWNRCKAYWARREKKRRRNAQA